MSMRQVQGQAEARRRTNADDRRALSQHELTLELVFHPEALAFDDDRVGMMQQPIEDCRGQGAVMVEDRGPLLKSTVGGNDERPLFIAQADHLEEQIGACLVNRQIAEFIEDEQGRFGVFFEFRFEPARALGCGQGIDDINGTGKAHGVALEASRIASGGRQVRFPQAHPPPPQKNAIGFILDKREAEMVLHLEAVTPRGPVPAELL